MNAPRKRVLCIFGTRPEAIKMAPVVAELTARPDVACRVCVTAQHREMLDQVLQIFRVAVDDDLDVMRPGQALADLTARLVTGLDEVLARERPDVVLVQGDTTTAFVAALAAFYRRVPVGHVEAGLRTHDLFAPWPEEANRQLVTRLARWHFAPTAAARAHLLAEGVDEARITVTGNTVIDALLTTSARLDQEPELLGPLAQQFSWLDPSRRLLLVTAHRRESFGPPLVAVCQALRQLAGRGDVQIVYPVHPNPSVQEITTRALAGVPGVTLIKPVDYLGFVYLMKRAHLLLTDSGGVQEEAPSLGKPVLVLRDVTERPEGVVAGTLRLVGTETAAIVEAATTLLEDQSVYASMSRAQNPYGDGLASRRIVDVITRPDAA